MDSTAATPHPTPAHTVPLHISDEQSAALLADTLSLLGQGLPHANDQAGRHELERWELVLEASDRPGLAKTCQEIKLLRQLLDAPGTQAHQVAEVLASLGAETAKVSEESAGSYAESLHQLSGLLIKAGNLLSR